MKTSALGRLLCVVVLTMYVAAAILALIAGCDNVSGVNHPPVANDQSVATPTNTPIKITLTSTDEDGHRLTFTIDTRPEHGILTGNPPDLTYTPNTNYIGPDSLTFHAGDGYADGKTATVNIMVLNNVPVAYDQSVITPIDVAIDITLIATDEDGHDLTYTVDDQSAYGTLTGDPPNLTYTPEQGSAGFDSFTFHANDGYDDSNIATVTITVGDIWYVNDDATGANNGTSWADAFNVIQDAMDAAIDEDMIWVAEGTYTGGNPVLTMKDGVDIYGGFNGTEVNLLERNTASHETILDGEDINRVVKGASNARLDGFTITNGYIVYVSDSRNAAQGAGMDNGNISNLVVANCKFSGNVAEGGGSLPYNASNGLGGGIHNRNVTNLMVINCIFSDNHAVGGGLMGWGGAICSDESTLVTITNCTFSNNSADDFGGALAFHSYTSSYCSVS